MWYRCFSSSAIYVRIEGGMVCSHVWWNFLGREVGGSPRIRDVCWWGLRDDQAGWPVFFSVFVRDRIISFAMCLVAGHWSMMWISEPIF